MTTIYDLWSYHTVVGDASAVTGQQLAGTHLRTLLVWNRRAERRQVNHLKQSLLLLARAIGFELGEPLELADPRVSASPCWPLAYPASTNHWTRAHFKTSASRVRPLVVRAAEP